MTEALDLSHIDDHRLRGRRLIILGTMLALAGTLGVLDTIYAASASWQSSSMFINGLVMSFLTLAWCITDAQWIGYRIGGVLRVVIVLFAIVGFPIYAFRSRGRGGWRLLGLGLLFFIGLLIVSGVASWITALAMRM